jgi:hypothetical protein
VKRAVNGMTLSGPDSVLEQVFTEPLMSSGSAVRNLYRHRVTVNQALFFNRGIDLLA